MAPLESDAADRRWMRAACALARRGLGTTAPNPTVGCVIVRNGVTVGIGWTQPGGRPHGETEALAMAGEWARGATAYVSLEPCSHYGRTTPCTDALIEAGITRVVAATGDPDPRVSGRGYARLRQAGISTTENVEKDAASAINAGFFMRIESGRPLFTLKVATSLDGKVATATGASQWITGAASRARGHRLRSTHDAILVGIGTALADDPMLTCRVPGLEGRSPVRIVLDSRLRLSPRSHLAATARTVATWVFAADDAAERSADSLSAGGIRVERVGRGPDGRLDLVAVARRLGDLGLTRVLIEGGPAVATAFVRAGLVDRLAWFRAPVAIGGDGLSALSSLGVDSLDQAIDLHPLGSMSAGADRLDEFAVIRRED